MEALQNQLRDQRQGILSLQEEKASLEKKVADLQTELDQVRRNEAVTGRDLYDSNARLRGELESAHRQLSFVTDEHNRVGMEAQRFRQEMHRLQDELIRGQSASSMHIRDLERQNQESLRLINEQQREIHRLSQDVATRDSQLAALQSRLSSLLTSARMLSRNPPPRP